MVVDLIKAGFWICANPSVLHGPFLKKDLAERAVLQGVGFIKRNTQRKGQEKEEENGQGHEDRRGEDGRFGLPVTIISLEFSDGQFYGRRELPGRPEPLLPADDREKQMNSQDGSHVPWDGPSREKEQAIIEEKGRPDRAQAETIH